MLDKEVLEWVDVATKQYDVRCRSDVDTHPLKGFNRLGDGRVAQVLVGDGTIRIYTTKFLGDADTAEKVADALNETNKVAGYTRQPLSQA